MAVEWITELRVLQRAELEMGPKPLGRAQKIMCGSQTLEQEAVTLKLPWRPQDARAVGYLLRKAANRELNQRKRMKLLLTIRSANSSQQEKKSWRSEECFDIIHGDAEFGVCTAGFLPCFGDYS